MKLLQKLDKLEFVWEKGKFIIIQVKMKKSQYLNI